MTVCSTLPLIIQSFYWRSLAYIRLAVAQEIDSGRVAKNQENPDFIGIASHPSYLSATAVRVEFIYRGEIYCLLCMQLHRSLPMLLALSSNANDEGF